MAYLQNSTNKFKVKKNQNLVTSEVLNLEKQQLLIRNKVSNLTFYDKFMNLLMIDGKKIKAYNIFYESLRFLEAKNFLSSLKSSKQSLASSRYLVPLPYPVGQRGNDKGERRDFITNEVSNLEITPQIKSAMFTRNLVCEAIENVKPSVEVRKVRKGGITYQVPAMIPQKRQETLAIRWIIDAAKNRKRHSKTRFAECLALELTEASKKFGKPRQKRDELHKLAESNRAYIRFRWW